MQQRILSRLAGLGLCLCLGLPLGACFSTGSSSGGGGGIGSWFGGSSASGGEWFKQGTDSSQTARDLSGCQSDARRAIGYDARIDQDIAASRGGDWQRTGSYNANVSQMRDSQKDRQLQYVSSCMRQRGYSQPK